MLRGMDFEDKFIIVKSGKKKYKVRADVGLLVVLRRLAFPLRFWDMVEDCGIPSHKLCEIFHSTLDVLLDKFHAIIEFSTW